MSDVAITKAEAAHARACAVIPGGLTSAARAGVLPHPLYVREAHGCRMVDIDGTELIDFGLANGPLLLGHDPVPVLDAVVEQLQRGLIYGAQHELEAEVAELLVELVPCAEAVLINTTGSEAVHTALRLARTVTGRRRVARFEGHYHGWFGDIAYGGPGAPPAPAGAEEPLPAPPLTGGMLAPQELAVLRWNDLAALEAYMAAHGDRLAAVIMEPVPLAGLLAPDPAFLKRLRQLTRAHGALLIFDEVVTGFRLGAGGAQARFGVTPDMAVLGKAIAAGFQVSAVVGRADVLAAAGDGRMAHMGTFNGHPPSLAAAAVALRAYRDPALHEHIAARTEQLADGLTAAAQRAGVPLRVPRFGGLAATLFADPAAEIVCIGDLAAHVDRARGVRFAAGLMTRGVFAPPRGTWMLSAAHEPADVDQAIVAASAVLDTLLDHEEQR